jgi:hypothetical protein
VYVIRGYDTTGAIPRFNNSGSQVSILLLQNAGTGSMQPAVNGHVWFWNASGVLLGATAFSLGPAESLSLNTSTVPGAAGTNGAVTISHDGRYGQLAGKITALEPTTGFTFDTPLVSRPR